MDEDGDAGDGDAGDDDGDDYEDEGMLLTSSEDEDDVNDD